MKFLMDRRDHKAPEPAHASEFAARTYFVWLAEASTSWGENIVGEMVQGKENNMKLSAASPAQTIWIWISIHCKQAAHLRECQQF